VQQSGSHHSSTALPGLNFIACTTGLCEQQFGTIKKIPKVVLDIISKRATLKQCTNYTTASIAIKLYNGTEARLGEILRNRCYINDRQPKKGIFFDNSKCKIGKQSFVNRLHLFSDVKFEWIGPYSEDYIRQNLKKLFIFQH